MAYVKTVWVDGTTAITAARLNNIEDGVEDTSERVAYGGITNTEGGLISGPTGWSGARIAGAGAGRYRITHNLGQDGYVVIASPFGTSDIVDLESLSIVAPSSFGADSFDVTTRRITGTNPPSAYDVPFTFFLVFP